MIVCWPEERGPSSPPSRALSIPPRGDNVLYIRSHLSPLQLFGGPKSLLWSDVFGFGHAQDPTEETGSMQLCWWDELGDRVEKTAFRSFNNTEQLTKVLMCLEETRHQDTAGPAFTNDPPSSSCAGHSHLSDDCLTHLCNTALRKTRRQTFPV
jgi:hypothetical protein